MKYGKDDRFKGIEKMKDRENLFVEFMAELKKKEKENSKMKQDKVGFLFPWGIRMDSRGNTSLMKFPLSVMYLDLDGVSDCFTVNVHPFNNNGSSLPIKHHYKIININILVKRNPFYIMITLSQYFPKNTSPLIIKLTQTPYCYNNM